MDILKFVNSNDIRKHLESINYQFNAVEAIWLIHQAYDLSFEERKRAYYDIIDNFSDMLYVDKIERIKYDSVHKIIIEYVALIEKCYKEFKQNDGSYYYEATINYPNHPSDKLRTVFKNYDDAIKYIQENRNDFYILNIHYKDIKIPLFFDGVHIEKKKYGSEKWVGSLDLNSKLEFADLSYRGNFDAHSREYRLMYEFIDSMWLKFPTPFKKGDIVMDKYGDYTYKGCSSGPFVLDKLCYEAYGEKGGTDSTDMTAYGYFLWEDGSTYYECMHAYMNLEYYRESITDAKRTLIPLSNFMKDNIALDLCVNGYYQILIDELKKKHRKSLWYTKEGFIESGIEEQKNAQDENKTEEIN